MSRSSTRRSVPTTRFVPESAPTTKKRARVASWKEEPEIPMDLGQASSSFVDSNRIATGTLTPIDSNSLVPGKLYSIWHKFEKTEDITDPVVGVEAGQRDSKDKYYVRFKGRFVGYDRGLSARYPDGITGIPPVTELAVFEQVRIISTNKNFFTTDIYLVGKPINNPNIKFGINVYTLPSVLHPTVPINLLPPVSHPLFKKWFDKHIASGKGRVAFDMDYWSFANDFATLSKNLDSERQNEYNKFALNSFMNSENTNENNDAFGVDRIYRHTGDYLGLKPEEIPEEIPLKELFNRGSNFNPYVDLGEKYPRSDNSREQKMEDVDGGARRKTRRRKMRKNKTRSKRRRSTRSRK